MTNPRDEIRELLARYPSEPDQRGAAEIAAEVLGQYGFTADDIADGLAEGGSVDVLNVRDDDVADRPGRGPFRRPAPDPQRVAGVLDAFFRGDEDGDRR